MTTSASSVMLVPHNFFDRDPSRASAQGVKLSLKTPGDGGGSEVKYYGGKYTKGIAIDLVLFTAVHV
jgi:primary-amine oxidase